MEHIVERISKTGLFDSDFFFDQSPPFESENREPLRAFLEDHNLWRYSPHPFFDSSLYLDSYLDVAQAHINPLYHYLSWGSLEGRIPHRLFDEKFYRATYLREEELRSGLEHYILGGAEAGNLPYQFFDYDLYRRVVHSEIGNLEIFKTFVTRYFDDPQVKFRTALSRQILSRAKRKQVIAQFDYTGSHLGDDRGGLCDVVMPMKDATQWTARSLYALLAKSQEATIGKILIVDDGNSEEANQLLVDLCQLDGRISVVRNINAAGFASACNFGAANTSAPYILFLNSDCLISNGAVEALLHVFAHDQSIGLVCPLSNNAANVTIPLLAGCSYQEMHRRVSQSPLPIEKRYPDVCTTVGHCLMVSRKCYAAVGGMDTSWGLGYGEESDFHLRAASLGFRGVLATDVYVYHFGGGTFRSVAARANLQQKNHKRFMELWGAPFGAYFWTVEVFSPMPALAQNIGQLALEPQSCDILFVLPGMTRGVGGIQVVVDLCNFLLEQGLDARVVILGALDRAALMDYPEPLYFSPFHAPNEESLLNELQIVPKVVIPTLFATVPAAYKLAKKWGSKLVNFVQGYEFYFEDGLHYERVKDTLFLGHASITTSTWLTERIRDKAPGAAVEQKELGVDPFTFYPQKQKKAERRSKIRIGMVLRAAPDKGQFVLRELCDQLLRLKNRVSLTLFKPNGYEFLSPWIRESDTRIAVLPLDRPKIAQLLREVDIFVDASLHEGFGLFPLEAMACGAAVVAADSGGITHFLKDCSNGIVIERVNRPEAYLEAIQLLLDNPIHLKFLRDTAVVTGKRFNDRRCYAEYEVFLKELLQVGTTYHCKTVNQ
jgi:glycosyltransferase involved in cell wall biosynthesis/GT2 family glycosyltransferase